MNALLSVGSLGPPGNSDRQVGRNALQPAREALARELVTAASAGRSRYRAL